MTRLPFFAVLKSILYRQDSARDLRKITSIIELIVLLIYVLAGLAFLFFDRDFTHHAPTTFWIISVVLSLVGIWQARHYFPNWVLWTFSLCFLTRVLLDVLTPPMMMSFDSKAIQRTVAYIFPFMCIAQAHMAAKYSWKRMPEFFFYIRRKPESARRFFSFCWV